MNRPPVSLHVHNIKIKLRDKARICAWVEKCLNADGRKTSHISIILCSDDYLSSLNKSYLGKNSLTDVLAFGFNRKGDPVEGDIFVSLDRVRENAKSYKASLQGELRRVIIHGALHLAGYRDKTAREKKRMTEREDELLHTY